MSKIERGNFTIQGIKYIVVEREELKTLEAERDKYQELYEETMTDYKSFRKLSEELEQQLQKLKEGLKECDEMLDKDWAERSTTWLEVYGKMMKISKKIKQLLKL